MQQKPLNPNGGTSRAILSCYKSHFEKMEKFESSFYENQNIFDFDEI